MAGGRPPGTKSSHKATRKQTPAQKQLQVQRIRETKEKTKQQREAKKKDDAKKKKAEGRAKWRGFFSGREDQPQSSPGDSVAAAAAIDNNDTTTAAVAAASAVNTASANNTAAAAITTNATTTATMGVEENNSAADMAQANNDSEEHDVVTINNPAINGVVNPDDATANLDYDEDEANKKGSDDFDDDTAPGIQQRYVKAIQKQVQCEVSKDNKNINNQWLVQHLRKNDWWIRKEHYLWFIRMYNKTREKEEDKLNEEYKAYYRDVFVWLPHIRWETPDKKYMPYCPTCKSNAQVGPHCFRDNHAGRVIVDLTETYYTVSMRYICYECEKAHKKAKTDFEAAAKQQNLTATVELDDNKYTFMGWDQKSLPLLPYNKGSKFPAFLTWRAGVDKKVVTKLRQDVDSGKGFDRISKDLLEYHTEKYTDMHLEYEYGIKEKREGQLIKKEYPLFGDFKDRTLYRGLVPTGAYLQHVYELHHESIRAYLLKEVKKRGSTSLHWDVSYKEAKHISRVRGQPVFKGLVTAMNEFGEIRIPFHVYTDSHEQMTAALEAFKHTTEALGQQPPVQLFWTDNPSGDRNYFMEQIPSLKEHQDLLNAMCDDESGDGSSASKGAGLPLYDSSLIDFLCGGHALLFSRAVKTPKLVH